MIFQQYIEWLLIQYLASSVLVQHGTFNTCLSCQHYVRSVQGDPLMAGQTFEV